MNQPLTLMIVHAHPDDEVIGSGGTLAHYSDEGIETALLEHRTQIAADGPFLSMPEEIGRQWFGVEYYTLLRSRVPLPEREGYEDDLFAGIARTD